MQHWSKNGRKSKIMKSGRNSRLHGEVVDWIGSNTGLIWAVASDSRLHGGHSRLHERDEQRAAQQHARRAARSTQAMQGEQCMA